MTKLKSLLFIVLLNEINSFQKNKFKISSEEDLYSLGNLNTVHPYAHLERPNFDYPKSYSQYSDLLVLSSIIFLVIYLFFYK